MWGWCTILPSSRVSDNDVIWISRGGCNIFELSLSISQVLQQLDEEGCARVARVLRSLPQATVLLVGQSEGFAARTFDAVDVVVKRGGVCTLEEA